MLLSYANLDDETRRLMLEEIEYDITNNQLYFSTRFSSTGRTDYPSLLKQAVTNHDDEWLALQLRSRAHV